ncbi:MAG: DUF2167 domain-containing protein, partial [Bacteroidia bacterium]|nr:DUF2167 domain-containing protein [Bacteroidia bacterium]
AYMDSVESTLVYEHGEITLGDGIAVLQVPQGYKYLGPEGSKTVLTDLWGNPPSETLGMLFPEDISPVSDDFTYAIEISYTEEGFIDDEDAEDIDYDELLESMQEESVEINQQREAMGYESIEFVGWASAPYYDQENKKLHWAKELRFGDSEGNTLNYNIRVLGRKGFLTMNAIGDIDVLPQVNQHLNEVLASVEFTPGNMYSDFDPDLDEVAAYGIGGLIAGKVLAKAGFFVVLLKFWKIIAVAIAGAFAVFKKKIFGSKDE